MTTLREAAQKAVDTFDSNYDSMYQAFLALKQTISDLRAALAEPEPTQEPVAWQWMNTGHFRKKIPANSNACEWRPLYHAIGPARGE